MLKNPLNDEDEIEAKGYNESLDPLDGETSKNTENVPAIPEVKPNISELDPLTGRAIEFRYRIFCGNMVRIQCDANGNIYFVADDICKILGYANTTKAIKDHCGKVIDSNDIDASHVLAKKITVDTKGGKQAMIAITEGDLYRLIFRSRMPEARTFESWVVDDVLPEIRKTGKYKVKRKLDYQAVSDAGKSTQNNPDQLELFPRTLSIVFPKPLTQQLNAAKAKLARQGMTFPTNKDFTTYLITKALEDIDG